MRVLLSIALALLLWRASGAIELVTQAVSIVTGNWGGIRP